MSEWAHRVETAPRLAQWRIDTLSSCAYRKSDPFKIGIWNWFLTVERNKQLLVKLYPEVSALPREQPPIASFVIKLISSSSPSRKTLVHPGVSDKLIKTNEDFVWAVDTLFTGRFIVDVEFLDLKIVPPSGGEAVSVWSAYQIERHSLSTAITSLSRMLSDSILTDITITGTDGASIGAHRAVLAARSPVFRRMFSHDVKEKKSLSAVDISDMPYDACRTFLGYVYGDFRADDFLAHRLALLRAADKYDMKDLKEACHESLLQDIDAKNVLERLQTAHLYRLRRLKSGCFRYLVNFGKVYEIRDEFNAFLLHAGRELITETFQEVLAAWKGF